MRKYVDDGIAATLVCCTGGEAGDILNPAMDRPGIAENLPAIRMVELGRSAQIIGFDRVELLGYSDSGMEGTEANAHPGNFANAPFDEAVGRLVAILRRERPQVVITYGDDQRSYAHPDHLRVYDISLPAIEAAADAGYRPELGGPHEVDKVYSSVWYRKRMEALHLAMGEAGLESPFDEGWRKRWSDFDQDHRVTTLIDVSGYYWCARAHCWPTPPRSTPMWGSGSGFPMRSPTGSSPTTRSCSNDPPLDLRTVRTGRTDLRATCSPDCGVDRRRRAIHRRHRSGHRAAADEPVEMNAGSPWGTPRGLAGTLPGGERTL